MSKLLLLDESQFRATFVEPMRRINEDEEFEPVPLKEYVEACLKDLGLPDSIDDIEIHHVYVNGDKTFCHVMLDYGQRNRYLVIVTDSVNRTIHGHHILDVNEEYGITNA